MSLRSKTEIRDDEGGAEWERVKPKMKEMK